MDIKELLKKQSLTEEEKNILVNYICDEEKKLEGINFQIITYPKEKKKFKLFKNNNHKVTLGFQKTILGFMKHQYEVAVNCDKIEESKLTLPTLLTTIYHELAHVKQKTMAAKARFPLTSTSLISKELLITLSNGKYYKNNYESVYGEIDARIKARNKTLHLLDRNNKKLAEEVRKDFLSRNAIDTALKTLYVHKNGNDIDLGEILLSKKIDKLVYRNPELLDAVPSLVFEYHNNGTRKDLKSLYSSEPYYLDGKNEGQKVLIKQAFDEFMFIYAMASKGEALIKFCDECGKNGLIRVENALKSKEKNLKERKTCNKKLYDIGMYSGSEFLDNNQLFDNYIELINVYLKLIQKLYTNRQTEVKK